MSERRIAELRKLMDIFDEVGEQGNQNLIRECLDEIERLREELNESCNPLYR